MPYDAIFAKDLLSESDFFQRFFNNHLIRVENRGIFLDEFLSLPSAAIWKFLLSLFYPIQQQQQTK